MWDGLLYHESDLRIEEHYTDTAGFTDHILALCHLLGFRFAPRIRNLADTRLYAMEKPSTYGTLTQLILGGVINRKQVVGQWDEILGLATSNKHGSVRAFLILRKLGAYPRQNGLAVALRELGKVVPAPVHQLAQNCGAAFMSGSIKARRKMHWQGPCSSTEKKTK